MPSSQYPFLPSLRFFTMVERKSSKSRFLASFLINNDVNLPQTILMRFGVIFFLFANAVLPV